LYVAVDLSIHGARFLSSEQTTFADVSLYYLHTFATLLEIFSTLAFLLASLRVLFHLNNHRELVALQMAGLSKKRLLFPFFLFASLLSLVGYANSQWFAPEASDISHTFMSAHKAKKKKRETSRVYSLSLEDDSNLVYQRFDPEKKELFDVFWIRTPHDIWHMKYLTVDPLRGRFVNHLTRNSQKQIEKSESFPARDFPEIPWDEEAILHKFVPPENRPLSTLFSQAVIASAERHGILAHLYYKLLAPLTPFLILLAISPLSLRFSRNHPLFLIAAVSLFSFISLKVILDGMLILGETQTLPASLAIFGPIAFLLAFLLPPFARMR
jgi:lipopolysaccharide export system permease protein